MKNLVLMGAVLWSGSAMAGFVHPMDFDGTEAKKREVIEYIKARVEKSYCNSGIDMCQPTTLRMMEKKNLDSFKKATKATDRSVMDRVIKDYCNSGIDMCDYSTIWMMYQKNHNASQQSLTW